MVLSWFVINFLEKSLQLVHINMAQEVTESQIYHSAYYVIESSNFYFFFFFLPPYVFLDFLAL